MSLIPLFSESDVRRWLDIFQERAEEKLLVTLRYAGEHFVKFARESGKYIDHTGNLRSSIGYVIVMNGEIIDSDFQVSGKGGTDKHTGKEKGEKLARVIAMIHNEGMVLIGVAGMEYAVYVEAMESKDVISGASERTEEILRSSLARAFKDIA